MPTDVESELCFLERDDLYQTEKPYCLRFDPLDDISRHNLKLDCKPLHIADARSLNTDIEKNGFTLTTIQTTLTHDDFADAKKIESTYALEVQNHLKKMFGARHARVIDYNVRRRHPTFPISEGKTYEHQQPAAFVHLDFSHLEAVNMLRTLYGDAQAEQITKHRWAVVNVWRPLRGPLFDWPIAVCDARTFDLQRDAQDADAVHSEWTYENVLIHHHREQKWYYFSGLKETETMVFKCTDSSEWSCGPCPHAAFELPKPHANGMLRESVESRVFLLWTPTEELPEESGTIYGRKDD